MKTNNLSTNLLCSLLLLTPLYGEKTNSCELLETQIKNTFETGDRSQLSSLYKRLGDCYIQQGLINEGIAAYQKALSFPYALLSFSERIEISQALGSHGHYDEAIAELQKILYFEPENQSAQILLSNLNDLKTGKKIIPPSQISEEKKDNCQNYLSKIHELEESGEFNKLGLLYKELGNCYATNQRVVKALDAYEKAFAYPTDLTISERLEMALFLGNQGRDDGAIEKLRKILKEEPQNEKVLITLAQFLTWRGKEGDQEEGEKYIDQILAKDSRNKEAVLIKGNILNYTNRSEEALSLFSSLLERKIELNPEEIFSAQAGLALAYINTKEFDKAEAQIAKLEPELAYQEKVKNTLLSKLQEKKEEPERKKQEFDAIIQQHISMGRELAGKGCYEAAYWEFYQALQRDPCNINAHIGLAFALGLGGRYCEALEEINFVLFHEPCNIDAWITKGMILRWKNDVPGSSFAYYKALEIQCDNYAALIGLAYTDLARDERINAFQLVNLIGPQGETQRKEVSEISENLLLGPNVSFDFFRFKDSDDIRTEDSLVDVSGYWHDWRFDIFYHHVHATQPVDESQDISISKRVDEGKISALKHISPCFDFGGGIGYADTSENQFITENVKANWRTGCGVFSAGSIYELYTLTAAAIFFEIRTWRNYISYENKLSGRWTVGGNYAYTKFSDANHSHRAELFAKYQLYDGRCLDVFLDYHITYWDFETQINTPFLVPGVFGGHGYFNPKNYFENLLLATFSITSKRLTLNFQPAAAYVTYEQSGLHNGVYILGRGEAILKFTNKFSIGMKVEGGRFPLKNLKYNYSILSALVRWAF